MKTRLFLFLMLCFCALLGGAAGQAGPTASPSLDPLSDLLTYARAVIRNGNPAMAGQEMISLRFFAHPYARRALITRVFSTLIGGGDLMNPDAVLRSEIADATRVVNVLAARGKGMDRLRALAELHPLTILSSEEMPVLEGILREMVRNGSPFAAIETIARLILEMGPFQGAPRQTQSMHPLRLEIERLCLLARRGDTGEGLKKAVLDLLERHPFSPDMVFGAACVFARRGDIELARDLLARLPFLESPLTIRIKIDHDLAVLREDIPWFQSLELGNIRPTVKPGPNPGVKGLTIHYRGNGTGGRVSIVRTLQWRQDRFLDEASGTEVSADLIGLVLASLSDSPPSPTLQPRLVHYEAAPVLKVIFHHLDGTRTHVFSNSHCAALLPLNIAGQAGLGVSHSPPAGQALQYLLTLLEMKPRALSPPFTSAGVEVPRRPASGADSPEELAFRREAGLPECPSSPAPEAVPEELSHLPVTASPLDQTVVLDLQGKPVVDVDRYRLVPVGSDSRNGVSLIRARLDGETIWYPEPPGEFLAHGRAAFQRLDSALGERSEEYSYHLEPDISSLDEEGFPCYGDLQESLRLLQSLGAGFEALGPSPVRSRIIARSPSLTLKGYLLLGSDTIFFNDVEFGNFSGERREAQLILAWTGITGELASTVQTLSLRHNGIHLDLKPDLLAKDLNALREAIARAGRDLVVVEERRTRRLWLVKPTQGTCPRFVISREGALELQAGP